MGATRPGFLHPPRGPYGTWLLRYPPHNALFRSRVTLSPWPADGSPFFVRTSDSCEFFSPEEASATPEVMMTSIPNNGTIDLASDTDSAYTIDSDSMVMVPCEIQAAALAGGIDCDLCVQPEPASTAGAPIGSLAMQQAPPVPPLNLSSVGAGSDGSQAQDVKWIDIMNEHLTLKNVQWADIMDQQLSLHGGTSLQSSGTLATESVEDTFEAQGESIHDNSTIANYKIPGDSVLNTRSITVHGGHFARALLSSGVLQPGVNADLSAVLDRSGSKSPPTNGVRDRNSPISHVVTGPTYLFAQ